MVETAIAESSLKYLGLDSCQTSTIMENVNPSSMNGLMGQLDKSGVGEFGDLCKTLPNEMLESFAKELGIAMPLGGYKSTQEVLFDLTDGTEKIVEAKPEGAVAKVVGVFGIATTKLLITTVTGNKDINWNELAGKFKSGLKKFSELIRIKSLSLFPFYKSHLWIP